MEANDFEMFEQSKKYLLSTSKWMKFMAIIMSISVAMMVVVAIVMLAGSTIMNQIPGFESFPAWIFGLLYLIIAVIYIFPLIYMFRASSAAREVVEANDNEMMVEFLKNNKSFWKFCGIFTIVMLGFCALVVPVCVIALAVAAV